MDHRKIPNPHRDQPDRGDPRLRWRVASLVVWAVALAGALACLHAASRGGLRPPPLARPEAWGTWLGARGPITAAFAVLNLGALGLAWYLLATTVAAVVARSVRSARLMSLADVVTVPAVRRLVNGAFGAGLAGVVLAAGVGTPAGPASSRDMGLAPAQIHLIAAAPPALYGGEPAGPPVMRLLPDGAQPAPAPTSRSEWTVRPGDHLWSVAAQVVADAWERQPTEAEVTRYWMELVDANRSRLADPANADLVFPGQVMALPAPPPR